MDLVNSVTQNSNNKNVTMENQPPSTSSNNNQDHNYASQRPEATTMHMRANLDMAALDPSGESSAPLLKQEGASPSQSQLPEYLRVIGMDPKKYWPKKYRFTREKTPGQYQPLSIQQRNSYENNGFLVLDGCNSQKLINAIRSEHHTTSVVSESLVDKLVAKNGKLLQYVKCFCDDRVMLMTHRLVETFQSNLSVGSGQRRPLIRDWTYLPFRPMDKIVCAITAIEPLENLVLVVPGTHKVGQCTITSSAQDSIAQSAYEMTGQDDRWSSVQAKSNSTKELFECSPENLSQLVEKSQKGPKYVDLRPGQTLFYHPGLVHGFSGDLVNSQKSQLASIAYYASADCEYIEMKRQDVQSPPATGPLPIGLAHFGNNDPSDYSSWINRPRLLQDLRASL